MAQENSNSYLRLVLNNLEKRFEISFTYMDDAVDSIKVVPPDRSLSLQKTLEHLESRLGIRFIKLTDGYFSVQISGKDNKICGYLIDADSKLPIEDALIYEDEQATTTNNTGYFELRKSSTTAPVYARHINYKTIELDFSGSIETCPTFFLTSTAQQLKEVVIRNYLTKGIDRKLGGKTEIEVQNTDILPGLTEADVFFTLQALPGIQSINETVTDINIRGGSNDQNLVLWDGVRLFQTGHFFGLVSAINPHTVNKTTLIKNGTSAELGEGVSGTIQTETNKEIEDLKLEAGSNLINGDVLLEVPLKKSSFQIASRHSVSGIISTPTYDQYFERAFRGTEVINDQKGSQVVNSNEKFRFHDLSINFQHKLSEKTNLKAGFLNIDNSIQYQEAAIVDSSQISRVSRLDQGTLSAYLNVKHLWSDRFSTSLYGSVMNYKQESINFDVFNAQQHILENEILENSIKMKGLYFVNDEWDVSAGFQFLETGIRNLRDINTPRLRTLSKEIVRTNSFFMEVSSNPFQNTYLVAGIRSSYFNGLDRFRLEPRLALTHKLNRNISIEFLAETKSQTVVQVVDFQTDFLGVEKRKWELVNEEDIPLLTNKQFSLGVNYQKKWLLMTLEGFQKKVNGIVTSSQGFLNQFQFVRSEGSYKANGLELLINTRFQKVNAWFTYSYLKSDYSFPQLIPPIFRNNYDINHSISTGISYNHKQLELSSGINYRSGAPFTNQLGYDQNQEEIIYDIPNTLTLENYFRLDFSAKYTFKVSEKIKGKCGFSLWNVTNKNNVINTFYQYNNKDVERVNRLALGITPNVNLRFIYKP
jgi:outer membrane cobalamin receptor